MIATAAAGPPDAVKRGRGVRDPTADVRHVQLYADHAGRSDEHFSGRHESAAAVCLAMVTAWARPSAPVHALAQPLFTTIARAWPPDRSRWSRDTRTGAACARFVVKTAAAAAVVWLATIAAKPPRHQPHGGRVHQHRHQAPGGRGRRLRALPGPGAPRPQGKRIQCDEIWSFVYAKAKNVPERMQGMMGPSATCGRGSPSTPTPSSSPRGP